MDQTQTKLETLQKKYEQLFTAALKMRQKQKAWYAYHAKADLEAAKRYEREMDQLLKKEVELRKSGQLELF